MSVEYDGDTKNPEIGYTINLDGRPGWDYGVATLDVLPDCDFTLIPKQN
jgi:hypothetical protein